MMFGDHDLRRASLAPPGRSGRAAFSPRPSAFGRWPRRRADAFTLIEAMISLALGMVILLVVYSGFQQATKAMSEAERVARENRLLNAGMFMALEETDTWNQLDHPGYQPLRTEPAGWKARCVVQESDSCPGGDGHICPWNGGYDAQADDWNQLPQPFNAFEDTRDPSGIIDNHDARYWAPSNKRSWYRGDGAQYFDEDHRYNYQGAYGNWALFSNAFESYILVGEADGGPQYDAYTVVPSSHRWGPAMHKLYSYSLGWYGWFDYLPANAPVDYYDVYGDLGRLTKTNNGHGNNADGCDSSNPGKAPFTDSDPTYDDEIMEKHSGGSNCTARGIKPWLLRDMPVGTGGDDVADMERHGRLCLQKTGGYVSPLSKSGAERAVTPGWYLYTTHLGINAPPEDEADPTAIRDCAAVNRYMNCGYQSGPELIKVFPILLGSLNQEEDLFETVPSGWRRVTFSVRRFMKWGNVVSLCDVRIEDPIEGQMRRLQFPTVGTTLRGARIERGLDAPAPYAPEE